MTLRLRPYHPTYVVAYFGMGKKEGGFNKDGFNDVLAKIRQRPDLEVELVEQYDDICWKCDRLVEDKNGSVWGASHTCPSAQDEGVVKAVNAANSRVLADLGLHFGSVVRVEQLVKLLSQRIPILDDDMLGGSRYQKAYEEGLAAFHRMWKKRAKASR